MRSRRNWAVGALAGVLAVIGAANQAEAQETGNLQDLVRDLYGGDGISLAPPPAGVQSHEAHFAGAAALQPLIDLNNQLTSSLGSFTFNSTVSAISFDIEEGVPVRSQESLGPSFAERATTIGRGRVNVAASYSGVDFKQFNGTNLDDIVIDNALQHIDAPPAPTELRFEEDTISLALDLEVKQTVLAFFGTYGVTDNFDIGIVIPIVNVDASVRSVATIFDPNPLIAAGPNVTVGPPRVGGTFCLNPGGCLPASDTTTADYTATTPNAVPVHAFGPESPIDSNSGSATGVGDIQLRAKWRAFGDSNTTWAGGVLAQAQLATGDETDLLGTGSSALAVVGVISANFGAFNPHANLGYEHYFDVQSWTVETHHGEEAGVETFENDRSNVRGVIGFDVRARENLSFATEFLGRWDDDGDNAYDLALGGKWAPGGGVPLNLNFLFPINRDEGLRPDYVVSFGIESTF